MPQNQPAQTQPVVVKRVVQYKHKRSLTSYLIGTIFLLSLIIVLGAFISISAWLYTYKALTQETIVGELHVSKKVIRDGVPTTRVKYIPFNQRPAFLLGQELIPGEEIRKDINGDIVRVDTQFLAWQNWITLTGMRPSYKIYRVSGDFRSGEDKENFREGFFDIEGGMDDFYKSIEKDQSSNSWFLKRAYLSSAGINVTDRDEVYNIIVTEDGVALQRK